MENSTTDYTIYSSISDNNTYAINKEEVLRMKEMKKEYTNEIVPDSYKIKGYLTKNVVVTNNKVVKFNKSDSEIELQVNNLKPLLIG